MSISTGPWHVGEMYACTIAIKQTNSDLTIAKVMATTNRIHEAEDNANLITAGPDLLSALEGYIDLYIAFRSMPVGSPNSSARLQQEREIRIEDEAIAAITKARGEK